MRIVLDDRELQAALRYLPEHVVTPAVRLALNDAGRQGNTAGKKAIRERWNLTASFVNERIGIASFASNDNLELVIKATGRPIDLTHFGARWVRGNRIVRRDGTSLGVRTLKRRANGEGGVFYEAKRGEPGHLPSAFIAKVTAGRSDTHVGVFVRATSKRLPLIKKVLISVPSMFEQQPVYEAIRQVIEAKFPERFEHHIDRAVASLAGPS